MSFCSFALLQLSCMDGHGYESIIYAGKKIRMQNLRERCQINRILLMSNVIIVSFFSFPVIFFSSFVFLYFLSV